MRVAALATLERNWRDGYTVPSPRLYPFQWNWDAGFIALGHAYGPHPERAIAELRSLFSAQWTTGLLPHIAFHRPDPNYYPGPEAWGTDALPQRPPGVRTSGITQPPVHAFIIERLAALPLGRTTAWREFLCEIFPQLLALHRYLHTQRDPHGEGLACIWHNWEAGTDNSPAYDAALDAIALAQTRDVAHLRRDNRNADPAHRPTDANYRRYIHLVDLFAACGYDDAAIAARSPFLVQDVLFNCVLVRADTALATLARQLGEPAAEIERWRDRTAAAINAKLWDSAQGFYFSYDVRARRRIPVKTSSGFMPLFAGICNSLQRDALARRLTTTFAPAPGWRLCASTAPDEPAFNPIKYWRGPAWVNVNWMLHHGLLRSGLPDLAARVRSDTLAGLREAGLWEYFDPRPAEAGRALGLGTDSFSWSAALALDWLENETPL